jgi:hypothetical protein
VRALFHVSEELGIQQFAPRRSDVANDVVVWAVDEVHLRNYLVPRDCPRVAYAAGPLTTPSDSERFLGTSAAVLAIEEGWLERLRACRLYCYELPPHSFELFDENAGYYVSRVPVVPSRVSVVPDPVTQLASLQVDLRVLPSLWSLRDEVISSSLEFSIIRMGNARPRHA